MPDPFCAYELRTHDPAVARSFYAALTLVWRDDVLHCTQLPERAVARGARPHWVGHLGVADVAATAAELLAHGAEALGPARHDADGAPILVLRDPFGAIVGLRTRASAPPPDVVAWHQHLASDDARAFALYTARFGWTATATFDATPPLGSIRGFAWRDDGPSVGGMASIANAPAVHPQWLYFFPVADLEAAVAVVRARGGVALDVVRRPNGDRLVVCDDPQGAAFGLLQRAP